MKKYTIIVAGGSGSRMQAHQPKQFLELNGRPMLMYTLDAFVQYDADIEIVLVLPEDHVATWEQLVAQHNYQTPHTTTTGGTTRYESVRNGLNTISGEGLVAIHDGARPLITQKVINRTFEQAKKTGNGVAAVQMKDSIRLMVNGKSQAVDRSQYFVVQTPQTFSIPLIKRAFEASTDNNFTDDASVLEAHGGKVTLVGGSYDNLKITTPEDLLIASSILDRRK
ncbi:2-C-methyl-D-erythritol 4-phosphate cytidylyltransferase [Reichenbachiella carrageenanivorans]|uniref:2-C-methyl-D-erythritol 4-phosphate cytidylyltransferase n=1 Tax=Reichenbachiella carrageenanivorans TaxID=2979869 RepID=A0ABY6D396_9BACT|nr:2-C-methyl-D-erythritol 4-phosphate cytidylyltransferase [Reichenbachiella carrageenanivorans]UXX79528.1 2-C-methyl-D-erythritol 4-phosphate cytidylyltransferase [Reichenbachiella carrageenanivorans]